MLKREFKPDAACAPCAGNATAAIIIMEIA
jgi:hypothetical protein